MRQPISSAREGVHSTLSGDYNVVHHGDRTFCTLIKDNNVATFEKESGRGSGVCIDYPAATSYERWLISMERFAPRKE
jgi:hypothetical protein